MIYICMYVGMYVCRFVYKKYVCQNAWAELRGHNMRMLKVSLGQLKPRKVMFIGVPLVFRPLGLKKT